MMVMKSPTFEEEEKLDTMMSFVVKPNVFKEFSDSCKTCRVEKSKVLRAMVNLFLHDSAFRERVLRGVNNG
ncbi:hypothetical protein ES703_63444 [subsurface metagenome]